MLTIASIRHAVRTAALASGRSPFVAGAMIFPRLAEQQRRNYHENIVEHYENPRNVGSLDKNDESVGTVSASDRFRGAGERGCQIVTSTLNLIVLLMMTCPELTSNSSDLLLT